MDEELAVVPQDMVAALHCPDRNRDSVAAHYSHKDLAALHMDSTDPMADLHRDMDLLAALHMDSTDPMADLPQPLVAQHRDQSALSQVMMAAALHMDWVDSSDNYLDLSQAGLMHTPSPYTVEAAAHPDYHHRRWGCDSSVFFSLTTRQRKYNLPAQPLLFPPDIYGIAIIL
jgi:hypothetical protein